MLILVVVGTKAQHHHYGSYTKTIRGEEKTVPFDTLASKGERKIKYEKRRNKISEELTEKICHLYETIRKGTIV